MRLHVQAGYEGGRYFVLSSDLPGLNVETTSFEEFCAVAADVASDLIRGESLPAKFEYHRPDDNMSVPR